MSGLKTPTAMSPPRVQAKSPLARSNSAMAHANLQFSSKQSSLDPHYTTPGLMQAFEELKSSNSAQAMSMSPRLPPIIHNRSTAQRGGIGLDHRSDTTFQAPDSLQGEDTMNLGALVEDSSLASPSSPSIKRLSGIAERDRPSTAPPQRAPKICQPISPINNAATALESPFKAYGHISDSVIRSPSYGRSPSQPTPSPELEVYKRHESNGRLMVCEAREEHCSKSVTGFVGEPTGLRGMADLKAALMRMMGHLGNSGPERAKADLKVVTVRLLTQGRVGPYH